MWVYYYNITLKQGIKGGILYVTDSYTNKCKLHKILCDKNTRGRVVTVQ